MNGQQASALAAIAGGAMGGVKLILIGACLAVGFSIGNVVVRHTADTFEGWRYGRLEKKHRKPKEEES